MLLGEQTGDRVAPFSTHLQRSLNRVILPAFPVSPTSFCREEHYLGTNPRLANKFSFSQFLDLILPCIRFPQGSLDSMIIKKFNKFS